MTTPTPTPVAPPPERFNIADYLLQQNAGRPDKAAFIDETGQITYGQLAERVRRAAAGLKALYLRREERVLLLMQDSIDWPVAFLGSLYGGMVPVAINTLLTADDYAYMLEHSRAQAVFVSGAQLPALKSAMTRSDHEVQKVIVSRPLAPLEPGEVEFNAFLAAQAPLDKPAPTGPDDPAFWAGACAARKASNSTSAGCKGAAGRETMTFCTSWSDLTIAAVSVGSSAPETSTACARACSSM